MQNLNNDTHLLREVCFQDFILLKMYFENCTQMLIYLLVFVINQPLQGMY